jgi:hypothetical protein
MGFSFLHTGNVAVWFDPEKQPDPQQLEEGLFSRDTGGDHRPIYSTAKPPAKPLSKNFAR